MGRRLLAALGATAMLVSLTAMPLLAQHKMTRHGKTAMHGKMMHGKTGMHGMKMHGKTMHGKMAMHKKPGS